MMQVIILIVLLLISFAAY
ncbi:type I toxin-antitoxin system Ibs family toxin [Salmonella enterica subsp. enterica serovar Senftenberg]|nr:type I toxin-antitoxin system Ibs family toxin [Salmonella enterica subsp. enterica serovar Senftenberg]